MQLRTQQAPKFRGSRWLDIAVALRDEPRTIQRCAQVLGVHSGAIYRQLHDMLNAGLLTADGPATGRGARFRLDPAHFEVLEEELATKQPPGRLRAEQPVLLLEADKLLDIALALQGQDLMAPVIWAAQLDDDRFVFGLDASVSPVLRGRVRSALEAAGVRCRAGRVSQVLDAGELRGYLAALRDAAL